MTRTILVTGGAGFIGSHACKALARAGYLPVTYDSMMRGFESAVRWGPLERGDIRDRARLADVIRQHKPSAIMHFAALALVGESKIEEALYRQVNVEGTSNLLAAMVDAGIAPIVFSSSCSIYGNPTAIPVDEQAPFAPQSVYAETKVACETLLASRGDVRRVSLRYFNATGADPEGELGENHEPETHLVPLALLAALGRKPPLTIYGDDYATPDGTCIRDYVHVSDLAGAHVAALRYLLEGGKSAAFNLGAGRGHSVRQVVDIAQRVIAAPVPHSIGARRAGDPAHLVADIAAARKTLNWQPRFAELESQIAHAWAWFSKRAPPE